MTAPALLPLRSTDDLVSEGWMLGLPADVIASGTGIARSEVGSRVMSLGLPARDHHRRPIEGTTVTPLVALGVDFYADQRRLEATLLEADHGVSRD